MAVLIPSAFHALCVYAEPLVAGRRVFVVDDASRELGARLVELGARGVHVYDPDEERARYHAGQAPRGVTVRELPTRDLDVRDGAFDVAIIPDLAMVPEPAALLARVRKLLGSKGVALIGARNEVAPVRLADANSRSLDYYELYDLIALQFAHVRMIGVLPFVGVAIAELGLDGDPEVSVDTQLATAADPPELFVALAGQDDVKLAEYAIVQLPPAALDRGAADTAGAKAIDSASDRASDRERVPASERAALVEAQLRASALAVQLEEAQGRATNGHRARLEELEALEAVRGEKLREAEARAVEHYVRAERLAHDLLASEEQRQREHANATVLEHTLRASEEMTEAVRARLEDIERRSLTREDHLLALEAALDDARSNQVEPEQLSLLTVRADRAEARAAVLEAELATIADAHAGEIMQLESVLLERAQALKALEEELSRRERMVKQLILSLEEQAPPQADADAEGNREDAKEQIDAMRADNDRLRARLDALALEAARREGDAATNAWRITELERQLEQQTGGAGAVVPASAPPGTQSKTPKDALQDELNALRQALTQEHEARVRAETGEELANARGELARQAALIEQLSRALEAPDRARLGREPGESAKSA
jgi:hypothetical protein